MKNTVSSLSAACLPVFYAYFSAVRFFAALHFYFIRRNPVPSA